MGTSMARSHQLLTHYDCDASNEKNKQKNSDLGQLFASTANFSFFFVVPLKVCYLFYNRKMCWESFANSNFNAMSVV